MTALVRGGTVRSHVQACADAIKEATGADSFGTYPGHDPSIDLALDIFVPVNSDVLGNKITKFAIENLKKYGIDYIIYRQHIYNPEIAGYWRAMEDRGSPTQNHYDHVHISFEPTAPVSSIPAPPKPPVRKVMNVLFVYDFADETGTWVTDGMFRRPTNDPAPYLNHGATHLGKLTSGQHNELTDIRRLF